MAVRTAQRMSPEMRRRYGLDRNPWPVRIVAGLIATAYLALLVVFAVRLTDQPIEARILVWQQPSAERLDITFDVNKPPGLALSCTLRAQDGDRVDIGYAVADLAPGPGYVQQTYRMRVLSAAQYVEILGCAETGEPMRVPPAAFPPGVAAPEQPWEPGP